MKSSNKQFVEWRYTERPRIKSAYGQPTLKSYSSVTTRDSSRDILTNVTFDNAPDKDFNSTSEVFLASLSFIAVEIQSWWSFFISCSPSRLQMSGKNFSSQNTYSNVFKRKLKLFSFVDCLQHSTLLNGKLNQHFATISFSYNQRLRIYITLFFLCSTNYEKVKLNQSVNGFVGS